MMVGKLKIEIGGKFKVREVLKSKSVGGKGIEKKVENIEKMSK